MIDVARAAADPRGRAAAALRACGAEPPAAASPSAVAISPIDGEELCELPALGSADVAAATAAAAFPAWRDTPAPLRAALLASLGRGLGDLRAELADLVTIETGKPLAAAAAEVAAAAEACDAAAAVASRVGPLPAAASFSHGRLEARVPLGPVAALGTFETPLLDWAAVAPAALACGCPVVWCPAAPLSASALAAIVEAARRAEEIDVAGLHSLVFDGPGAADPLAGQRAIELVERPAAAGLNVAIVSGSADLGVVVAAVTAATVPGGGRSPAALRLVLADARVVGELEQRLVTAFDALRPGNPLDPGTDLGPLRDLGAFRDLLDATQAAEAEGGVLLREGERCEVEGLPDAFYARPTLVRAPAPLAEIRAPVLFLGAFEDLDEAIVRRDAIPHRWSAIFGDDRSAARFLAAPGSARGVVGVGACPRETDLVGGDSWAWLRYARRVVRRVA